jgi:hypothetical protein
MSDGAGPVTISSPTRPRPSRPGSEQNVMGGDEGAYASGPRSDDRSLAIAATPEPWRPDPTPSGVM